MTTKRNTAMADAMRSAGLDVGTRLWSEAADAMRRATHHQERAALSLAETIKSDDDLIAHLARLVVAVVAADMAAKPGLGRPRVADNGHGSFARPGRENSEAKTESSTDRGTHAPEQGGEAAGLRGNATSGHSKPAPASPPKHPSKGKLDAMIATAKDGAKIINALGWIGTANMPNSGRPLTDIPVAELAASAALLVKQGAKRAQMAIALKLIERECGKLGVMPPGALWVDFLPPETVAGISRETEKKRLIPTAAKWFGGQVDLWTDLLEDANVD